MKSLSPFMSSSLHIPKSPVTISGNVFRSSLFIYASIEKDPKTHKPSSVKRSVKPSKTRSPVTTDPESTVPRKKVLVPIGFGTEEMEAVITVDVLRRAGADVTLASVEEQLEVVTFGGTRIVADTFVSACSDETFDLVALPGGMPGSARLRDSKVLQQITSNHAEKGRLYGAISAAPAVTLLPWGLLKRKQTTCHPAFLDKLPTFWAVKSNIQVSGELTTSRGPGTCYEFAVCLVDQLFGESVAKEIGESMLMNIADGESRKEVFNEVQWSVDQTPRVLIPVANGSEETEVVTIVDILRRAKAKVVIASCEKSLQIVASQGTKIVTDRLINTAADLRYDVIILPGGISGNEQLQKSRTLKKMLKEQVLAGRIFGAICSSPAILQKQGLIKDKRATAHPSSISMLNDTVETARVVIDGNLITGKGFATATDFALAIVGKLFGQTRARSVAEGLVFEYPSS